MERIRGVQDLKRPLRRGGEDKAYFEMYKLVSERIRLTKVRAALMGRVELIDFRISEISASLNAHHASTNLVVREGGEHHGTGQLAKRFWRFPGLDSESGPAGR